MKRIFDKRKENDAKITDAVQGIQEAANEDVLKDEYKKVKTSELYKKTKSQVIIDNLYKRKNVCFRIDKSLNISETNKLILKCKLAKLIPNTIEDGDDDNKLANLEIDLERCKKEISDKEEILDKKEILE
ncbi:340_t:CDS:1, partial [Racocetra fulgida]